MERDEFLAGVSCEAWWARRGGGASRSAEREEKMDMEGKILETLDRFISINRASLLDEVLYKTGNYSLQAERDFDAALVRLRDSGRAYNLNFHGYWAIPVKRPDPRPEIRRNEPAQDSRRGGRRA